MIPAAVRAQVALFQASVQAAAPISQASSLTKAALIKAGQQLVTQLDGVANLAGASLGADDPVAFAGDLPGALVALSVAAEDQARLVEVRGFIGRIVFNLAQA